MIYTVTPAPNIFIGVHRQLSECEQFGTKHIYLNQLNQVTEQDTVIFGAWEPNTYPMAIRRCKAKKKCLLFTSPLLQAQMNEPELSFLESILNLKGNGVIDYLLFADKETYEVFKDETRVLHLPHPADPKKVEQYKNPSRDVPGVPIKNIFCYMPWGNRNKNQMTQLAAVKIFQRKHQGAWLFANGMGPWAFWANRLQIYYTDQGYLPTEEYYRNISNYRCGLHVTLSESFAYSVLDAFLLEVPVICSPAIDWAPEGLKVKNPDDPVEIAKALEFNYDSTDLMVRGVGQWARLRALEKIKENNELVRETLGKII